VSGIVKPILLPAAIVDEMERSYCAAIMDEMENSYCAAIMDEMENSYCAAIMDEVELCSISSTIAAGSSIGLTIPDAVCTVVCS
jgi:hypothetical protein